MQKQTQRSIVDSVDVFSIVSGVQDHAAAVWWASSFIKVFSKDYMQNQTQRSIVGSVEVCSIVLGVIGLGVNQSFYQRLYAKTGTAQRGRQRRGLLDRARCDRLGW